MNYTIKEISSALEAAYTHLRTVTGDVHSLTDAQASMQRELIAARQRVILEHAEDPKALGSNEAARNAAIDALTAAERQNVQDVDDSLRAASNRQVLAKHEVELWRAQLRCAEVEVAAVDLDARGYVARV